MSMLKYAAVQAVAMPRYFFRNLTELTLVHHVYVGLGYSAGNARAADVDEVCDTAGVDQALPLALEVARPLRRVGHERDVNGRTGGIGYKDCRHS